MSTQAYYKDRLGFDPKEALFDGQPHEKYRKTGGGGKKEPHGYEENLTKFKGTTIWEYFNESTGTVVGFLIFKHGCFVFHGLVCIN